MFRNLKERNFMKSRTNLRLDTDVTFAPLQDVERKHYLTEQQMFNQNRTDKEILYAMDEDTYEELVASWAFSCLSGKYEQTYRIGGVGDNGIDILAVISKSNNEYDIYQCKHYENSLTPSVVYPEVCKILYHIFNGVIPLPKSYFILAPKNLTSGLIRSYTNSNNLKEAIKSNWSSYSKNIIKGKTIPMNSELSAFIDSLDFSIFKYISPDDFLTRLRENNHLYAQYFGIRKELISRMPITPPDTVQVQESNYINHLVDAYNDSEEAKSITIENVSHSSYAHHFDRARNCFWISESLRKMSEENAPGDTDEFGEFKKDMEYHVADTYEDFFPNALARNKAVIKEATTFSPKADRVISGEISSGEKIGVCYHLSNDNKLIWKQ